MLFLIPMPDLCTFEIEKYNFFLGQYIVQRKMLLGLSFIVIVHSLHCVHMTVEHFVCFEAVFCGFVFTKFLPCILGRLD